MTQDTKITSQKLRTALKTAFPNCIFSVSCKKFSMGQEINISWTNGVAEADIETLINEVEAEYKAQGIEIRNERSTFIFTRRTVSEENREAVRTSVLEELFETPVDGLEDWGFFQMVNGRIAKTTFF